MYCVDYCLLCLLQIELGQQVNWLSGKHLPLEYMVKPLTKTASHGVPFEHFTTVTKGLQ